MSAERSKYDYLVVGAGLFGSTFACLASMHGRKCLVVDRRSHTGGNCHSRRTAGIDVHLYGPHIFHTSSREVWDFVCGMSPMTAFFNQPIAVHKGEIYNLPFNMNTFARIYGEYTPEAVSRCLADDMVPNANPGNLEEYCLATVGRQVYERLIKGYTEKQWGMSCTELPASLIRRLPLRMTYDNTYFSDQYQGVPANGYDHLFARLLRDCDVILDCDYLQNRAALDALAARILYTGRLDEWFGERQLEFRCLGFEHEIHPVSNLQGCAVVNYPDPGVAYTRVTEHRHFNPRNQSRCTVITRETPLPYGAPEAVECYPVPTERDIALQRQYEARMQSLGNVIYGGRLADYRYYDMDTVIAKAMRLWENEMAAG